MISLGVISGVGRKGNLSDSVSFKLMTPLSTPIFESEALQRLRLLRQWKLNLTEFASTLKFVESGHELCTVLRRCVA